MLGRKPFGIVKTFRRVFHPERYRTRSNNSKAMSSISAYTQQATEAIHVDVGRIIRLCAEYCRRDSTIEKRPVDVEGRRRLMDNARLGGLM